MNKILQPGIVLIGLLIFLTSTSAYFGYTDNMKHIKITYVVQEDGTLKELSSIEVFDRPLKLLIGVPLGLIIILWALYWYPKAKTVHEIR